MSRLHEMYELLKEQMEPGYVSPNKKSEKEMLHAYYSGIISEIRYQSLLNEGLLNNAEVLHRHYLIHVRDAEGNVTTEGSAHRAGRFDTIFYKHMSEDKYREYAKEIAESFVDFTYAVGPESDPQILLIDWNDFQDANYRCVFELSYENSGVEELRDVRVRFKHNDIYHASDRRGSIDVCIVDKSGDVKTLYPMTKEAFYSKYIQKLFRE